MNQDQRPLAVVTGASSGIGRELARLAATARYDVVLVARREERLNLLAAELSKLGVTAQPVAADLSESSGVGRVMAALAGAHVDVLVNNAGVGGRGAFAVERDLATDLAMIRLNVLTLVELTGRLLPGMVQRRHGRVLNVASIAGYLPGPGQAVYNASKAFVRSFSVALAEETRGTGVHVTTLCAGPVRTEFAETAGYREEDVRSNPLMPIGSAAKVASAGWDGLMAGRAVVVPDLPTRVGLQLLRFVPWRLVMRTAAPPRRTNAEENR
jgi:short-subunit dehydrogenase